MLSLHLILSRGYPTTVFDFFNSCEGLRAGTLLLLSLLLVIQSKSCFSAPNNLQKAGIWLASRADCKVSGWERLLRDTGKRKAIEEAEEEGMINNLPCP